MSQAPTHAWDYDNGMMYDEEDDNLDGIESLMNERSEDDDDDDTNSRSDNDVEESSGEEDERDEAELMEDEENYRRFVHSVFFDDDARSANSFNDEDDEEYKPDEALDGEDEEDEDEERSGRRLDKVRATELQNLVNECWQTIVGEQPVLPTMAAQEEYGQEKSDAVVDGLVSPSKRRLQSPNSKQRLKLARPNENDADNSASKDVSSASASGEAAEAVTSTVPPVPTTVTTLDDLDSPNKSIRTNTSAAKKGSGPTQSTSGQSVISSLVSQMFTGEKPFEVCIEGMPVEAIRKLVARQMSMATQLLMQILLLADEKGDCFTTAYTSLMELSNLRDTALKKAKLIQMNMSNVAAIHSYNRDQQRLKKLRREGLHDDSSVASSTTGYENEAVDNILALKSSHRGLNAVELSDSESLQEGRHPRPATTTAVVERRLTRSGMSAFTAANLRSTSVFDIPALTKVDDLFKLIDQARQEMKNKMSPSTASEAINTTEGGVASTTSTVSFSEEEKDKPSKRKSSSDVSVTGPEEGAKQRAERLTACRPHISRIMVKSGMRVWNCLLPLRGYPLHESIVAKTDPSSLTGRSMFTPAEDDLLLRGIITLGENNWAKIKTSFLPSKEAQLLQFRFSQMTSLTANQDNNIFKRYQKLEVEYRNRDIKWSHEEDIDLLRGFQTFGERWPLIAIFFLPNRKRREIKHRWMQLQKLWQRGFQIHQVARDGSPTEMTDSMRWFLLELNFSRRSDDRGNGNNLATLTNGPPSSQSSGNSAPAAPVDTKVGVKRSYQNSAGPKFKAPVSSSVDMFLNQPAFGQYQYHHYPPSAPHSSLQQQQYFHPPGMSGLDPRSFPGSPPGAMLASQHHQPPQQLFPPQHQAPPQHQQAQNTAGVEADAQSYLGRFADSSTLMDFDMSSNFEVPQRVVDMTATPAPTQSVSASSSSASSFAKTAPSATAPFASIQSRSGVVSGITTTAAPPLSLGPFLLDGNRVPPSVPYVPVDYNAKRQLSQYVSSSAAAAPLRPTLYSSAVNASGQSSSSSGSATAQSQGSYIFSNGIAGDRLLSSPESQSRDSVTKINILKTKPKKSKGATAATPATPSVPITSTDTLDGFTLSSIPGFSNDNIQIIPSSIPTGSSASSSSASKKPPKAKSFSLAKKSPTKTPATKVKSKRIKASSTNAGDMSIDDQTSFLMQNNTDTISGLLHLPFDANATDSAWGLAAMSRHPYDAAVVNGVFNNDQSTLASGVSSSAAGGGGCGGHGEIIHDDGLFSNLMQLGGLSNLLPLQSPSRPARPFTSSSAALNTPGKKNNDDAALFSPPTGRLGQATNIKRKLSTSKNLIASLTENQSASSSTTAAAQPLVSGENNVSEVLSPSKKIKKGGLFASVMANVKK